MYSTSQEIKSPNIRHIMVFLFLFFLMMMEAICVCFFYGNFSKYIYVTKSDVTVNINTDSVTNKCKADNVLVFILGTRPEAIKLAPLIIKTFLSNFVPFIISTGQHKEMLKQALDVFELSDKIDINLNIMKPNQTLSSLTTVLLPELNRIIESCKPLITFVQGDTTSAFVGALASFYNRIPVAHVEAGLRTNNIYSPFPEEVNRKIISNIALFNFAATNLSRDNLLRENVDNQKIYVTGNTVVDSLFYVLNKYKKTVKVNNLLGLAKGKRLVLLTAHRRENLFGPLADILKGIYEILKENQDIFIIYPIHLNPNVLAMLKKSVPSDIFQKLINHEVISGEYSFLNRFHLEKPFSYIEQVQLMNNSYLILTDSGGIQEEAVSLGVPVLVLRDTTERPEGVLSGSAKLVGNKYNEIVKYVKLLLTNKKVYNEMAKPRYVYGNGEASKNIIDIITSHYYNKK